MKDLKNSRIIYISHPFTGDEKANVEDSIRIAKELVSKFPDIVFLNPLTALEHDAEICSYEVCMDHCLALLGRCDAIFMSGNWQDSRGCRKEQEFCVFEGIPVFTTEEELSNFCKMILTQD